MKLQQNDKFKHLMAGYIICALLSIFIPPMWAFFAAVVIGCAKEYVWDDWWGRGQFEVLDMIWTAIGGLMALLPQYIQ